ncbi:hypothetical protein MP228_009367 [Amoeboaphelidium protococcarum]|nr:hypothetical protein MP228_009367 [Amoeboaphelidium protococcarum]
MTSDNQQKSLQSAPDAPQDSITPPLASLSLEVASAGEQYTNKYTNNQANNHLMTSTSSISGAELSQDKHASTAINSQSYHGISQAEKTAFVKHINQVLADCTELAEKLPIDPLSDNIFAAVKDGVLLCKLVNASVPHTIDESKVIKKFRDEKSKIYHCLTNLNLALSGARRIGAIIVNVGAEDLLDGKQYLVFGLLWQIIKIGLLKEVSLDAHPELAQLQEGNENISDIPPEELLLKWFNYHLKRNGSDLRVSNFSNDIKTSMAYLHLLDKLHPELKALDAMNEPDLLKRAEIMLMTAEKVGVRSVVTPEDIVAGNERLNLVFTANMFNAHTGMLPVAEEMEKENESLANENKMLKDKAGELEAKLNSLNASIQAQKDEMENLLSVKTQITSEVQALQNEKMQLSLKISKVLEENQLLSGTVKQMGAEKKAVEMSREQLASRYDQISDQLLKTTEELEKERISLETSEYCGASLANDLEELRGRQEKLEFLIEHLKIERLRSDMHIERLRVLYNWFPSTEALAEAIYKNLTLANISKDSSKSGYLTKKARNGNNWKYRYFVLKDNFLFYFKSDKDQSTLASGVIRVDDAQLRFAENPTRKNIKDQWLLCIEIPNNNDSIKQHAFYIAGEDHELEGWKSSIRQAAGWWTRKSSMSTMNKKRSVRLTQ